MVRALCSPLGELRGAMLAHQKLTILPHPQEDAFLHAPQLLTQSKSREPEEDRPAATEGHHYPESFPTAPVWRSRWRAGPV